MSTRKKVSLKRKITIGALIFLGVLILASVGGIVMIHSYINKMNLVSTSGNIVSASEVKPTEALVPEYEDIDPNAQDSPGNEVDTLEEEIKKNMEDNSTPVMYDKNVFNVLLIGCDSRKEGGAGRSDVMMLISINKDTKQIVATSFLRDIYLQIPGKSNNRLNAAFAFGGADLLMDTLEQNFKIKIDRYALIDFYSFIDIVDAVGGIALEVTEDEVPVVNDYLKEINELLGDKEGTDYLSGEGTYLLNGKQALAYSRNRYVGQGDFARTLRQRKVIEQVFLKIKDLGLIEMKDLLDIVMPKVTTNLTEGELFTFILSMPSYMKYDRIQWSVPTEGAYKPMRINKMAVLGIDFDKTIGELQTKIYGRKVNE